MCFQSHLFLLGPQINQSPPSTHFVLNFTGLSDEIRANFGIMKDLAQHTRISPAARAQNLTQFMSDLHANPKAQAELQQWNMEFERQLLKMTGRCLGAESEYT